MFAQLAIRERLRLIQSVWEMLQFGCDIPGSSLVHHNAEHQLRIQEHALARLVTIFRGWHIGANLETCRQSKGHYPVLRRASPRPRSPPAGLGASAQIPGQRSLEYLSH